MAKGNAMTKKPLWMITMELEIFLGNSDRCDDCGHEFLAHSDGCPKCGSYRTTKLNSFEEKMDDWDMENFPVHVFSSELTHILGYVNKGDFSSWPRVEKN